MRILVENGKWFLIEKSTEELKKIYKNEYDEMIKHLNKLCTKYPINCGSIILTIVEREYFHTDGGSTGFLITHDSKGRMKRDKRFINIKISNQTIKKNKHITVLTHEFAHALMQYHLTKGELEKLKKQKPDKKYNQITAYQPNMSELIAECFVIKELGKSIHSYIDKDMKLVDEVLDIFWEMVGF